MFYRWANALTIGWIATVYIVTEVADDVSRWLLVRVMAKDPAAYGRLYGDMVSAMSNFHTVAFAIAVSSMVAYAMTCAVSPSRGTAWPLRQFGSPGRLLATCIAIALAMTAACGAVAGAYELVFSDGLHRGFLNGYVATFGTALAAIATCLVATGLFASGEIRLRSSGWTVLTVLSLCGAMTYAAVWAAFGGAGAGGGIGRVMASDPTFPYEMPFAWIGADLGLGHAGTRLAAIATSLGALGAAVGLSAVTARRREAATDAVVSTAAG